MAASRRSYPNQFSRLTGDGSPFQDSVRRFMDPGFAPPLALTGEDFRSIVTEQLAALWPASRDPEAAMIVAPSGHVVPDGAGFRDAVAAALPRGRAGDLLTFGIRPDRPEAGYGYLRLESAGAAGATEPQPLRAFVEKPDAEAAEAMLTAGDVLWAGILLFTLPAIPEAFAAHAPDPIGPPRRAVAEARTDLGFARLGATPQAELRDISIDYASWSGPRTARSCPIAAPGAIWAAGRPCGRKARPTTAAPRFRARPMPSTVATRFW